MVSKIIRVDVAGGAKPGDNTGHGCNQTRIVRCSHGVYAAYITDGDKAVGGDVYHSYALVRLSLEGCETLYRGFYLGGSNSPYIMADKDENIWVFAGSISPSSKPHGLSYTLWKYSPKSGQTEVFTTSLATPIVEGGYGYGAAFIDGGAGRIVMAFCGGGSRGYFACLTFDLKHESFDDSITVLDFPYRHCYLMGVANGKGGLRILAERDVTNEQADIAKYIKLYGNRKLDANYVWDELRIFAVNDTSAISLDNVIAVEEAEYHCERGLYPYTVAARDGDFFRDSNGNTHVIYMTDDNHGKAGMKHFHAIYDGNDALIYREPLFLGRDNHSEEIKLYQSVNGAFYLLVMPKRDETSGVEHKVAELEIWKSSDGRAFTLCHTETLEDGEIHAPYSLAVAQPRNGSVTDDIISCMMVVDDRWYYFEVNLNK